MLVSQWDIKHQHKCSPSEFAVSLPLQGFSVLWKYSWLSPAGITRRRPWRVYSNTMVSASFISIILAILRYTSSIYGTLHSTLVDIKTAFAAQQIALHSYFAINSIVFYIKQIRYFPYILGITAFSANTIYSHISISKLLAFSIISHISIYIE